MTRRWLVALASALAVPLIGWVMILWINLVVETTWRDALIAHYGSIPADATDRLRLESLCTQPDFLAQAGSVCSDTQFLNVLRWVAGLAAAAALLIVVVVGVVARAGRRSAKRAALLFPTMLKFVLTASAVLLVLQGALILGVGWEWMRVAGRVWPWLLIVIAIGVLVGAGGALGAVSRMGQRRKVTVHGLALRREQEPALFDEVDDIASQLDAQAPNNILLGVEANFFVVDADVMAFGKTYEGTTLFLSLAVMGALSRDEFRAIVGHELGHLRGEDTAFTRRVAPLYGAVGDVAGGFATAGRNGLGIVTLPVALLLQAVFGTLFGSLGEVKRARELEADRAGAEAASPAALASALVKLTRTSELWDAALRSYVVALQNGSRYVSVRDEFLTRVHATDLEAEGLTLGRVGHPFDSHPPTSVRLQFLGVPSAGPEAMDLEPAASALGLLSDPAALDEAITEKIADRVRPQGPRSVQSEIKGPSATLRRAALKDRGIAATLAMVGGLRGPDITRPDKEGVEWVALADLLLAPYPNELDFDWDVPEDEVPTGPALMVVDVAGPDDDPSRVLRRGTDLKMVGGVATQDDVRGIGEDVLVGPSDAPWAGGVVVVRAVGGGDPRPQAAGLFVTLVTDWLGAPGGTMEQGVRVAAQAMLRSRETPAPDGPEAAGPEAAPSPEPALEG